MKELLFILLFFTGVSPIIQGVYCQYYLILQKKTMSDARAYCTAKNNDLATVQTQAVAVNLNNIAKCQNCPSSSFIGLYNDVNSWRWSMGNEPLGSLRNWYSSNPDNWKSTEYCAVIFPWGWLDVSCTTRHSSICFDDRNVGTSRYILISKPMTWFQAQSFCRQNHTDLASARNATENSLLKSIVYGETWFGLFRNSWKWIDQTNFTTVTWLPGEPDNLLGDENCGIIVDGQIADGSCAIKRPFFCQGVITARKEIVRLKVQSNQNMNEPAVKATILVKVKQKLKDQENITVKWRKQPNGLC